MLDGEEEQRESTALVGRLICALCYLHLGSPLLVHCRGSRRAGEMMCLEGLCSKIGDLQMIPMELAYALVKHLQPLEKAAGKRPRAIQSRMRFCGQVEVAIDGFAETDFHVDSKYLGVVLFCQVLVLVVVAAEAGHY